LVKDVGLPDFGIALGYLHLFKSTKPVEQVSRPG
jgi:hypothetical protein